MPHYQAYGIPIVAEMELPALTAAPLSADALPITVKTGNVPAELAQLPLVQNAFVAFNQQEWLYQIPQVASYYVQNGAEITIEPLSNNWEQILLYFYSNCLAVALFQHNLLPFHASGVLLPDGRVLLLAAPSRTGKSTTALKLQERGYAPFTDDTAVLTVENGKCYAGASYPMARLWQSTIAQQTVYADHQKQLLYAETDKYGFSFHDDFINHKMEVAGVVFLEATGNEITVQKLSPVQALPFLAKNIYRAHWFDQMNKSVLKFQYLTSIAQTVPTYQATRPQGLPTFETFAEAIETHIIRSIINT